MAGLETPEPPVASPTVAAVLALRQRSQLRLRGHDRRDGRSTCLQLRTKAEHERAGTGYYFAGEPPIEQAGLSAFLRAGGAVFHTYSRYARGVEMFSNSFAFLDLTALGRQEDWEQPKHRTAPIHDQQEA